MKGKVFLFLFMAYGHQVCGLISVNAQEPVLESYSVSHGGNQSLETKGFKIKLTDKLFGNGKTKAKIIYKVEDASGILTLGVSREVKPGEVTFALLVFRVEIRGFSLPGNEIYSRNLEGFSFGDSQSGEWSKVLEDLPVNVNRLQVTFIGNYE